MSTDGWVDKQNMVYTWNTVFFSLKKEGNSDTWINLENITLSEMSQTQKDNYWSTADLPGCATYICFSHYGLLQDPECGCLCNTVGPCLFPI